MGRIHQSRPVSTREPKAAQGIFLGNRIAPCGVAGKQLADMTLVEARSDLGRRLDLRIGRAEEVRDRILCGELVGVPLGQLVKIATP